VLPKAVHLIVMQRDMGLIRQLLFQMEAHPRGFVPASFSIDTFSQEQISYHIWLLGQAELMRVVEVTSHGATSPQAIPTALTWAGHDFIDAARSDPTWSKAMEKAAIRRNS
jgi:hypothetical protein